MRSYFQYRITLLLSLTHTKQYVKTKFRDHFQYDPHGYHFDVKMAADLSKMYKIIYTLQLVGGGKVSALDFFGF